MRGTYRKILQTLLVTKCVWITVLALLLPMKLAVDYPPELKQVKLALDYSISSFETVTKKTKKIVSVGKAVFEFPLGVYLNPLPLFS